MRNRRFVILFFVAGLVSANSWAGSKGMSREQYENQYGLYTSRSAHWPNVKGCLNAWGSNHPFKNRKKLRFRVIRSGVKVFGLGSNVDDYAKTSYPQLILIESAVNVMGKTTYRLMNPNGWYCFEDNVNVMGKAVIETACRTHIATSSGSTTVMGSNPGEGGVTVMGKTVIKRHCD